MVVDKAAEDIQTSINSGDWGITAGMTWDGKKVTRSLQRGNNLLIELENGKEVNIDLSNKHMQKALVAAIAKKSGHLYENHANTREFEFSLPEAGASSGAGTAAPMTTLSIPEQFSRSEGGLFNSQSTAAAELNHLFGEQGFKFKKGTHRLLSRVVATAPNGTTKVFSANIYGDATEDNNELIKWMEDNQSEVTLPRTQ